MPIIKSKSKAAVGKNISELVKSKPGKTRAKGIATLAKKRGITKKKAKQVQAIKISLETQRKAKGEKG